MARFITRFAVRRAPWALLVAFLLLGLALTGLRSVEATTFTWTHLSSGNASGSWNTSGNWNSGVGPIASGADNTADFSTLNITADSTVTLDGNQTIGNLIFGDTNTGSAANWIVNTGTSGTLTLATSSGSPTITTNTVTATLNNVIAGSAGLTKQGTGTLILNNNNTYTGGTTISGGVLQIAGSSLSSPLGSGSVTNNASLVFSGSFLTIGNAISGTGTVTQAGDPTFGITSLTATNSYSGTTTITSGALLANDGVGLPTGSFLNLNGGLLIGSGATSFTRSLGTSGSGKFQWNTGGGGFGASGGQLTVNIGGAGGELVWGTTVGSQVVGGLKFGNPYATDKVLFVNGINLNNTATATTRTIAFGGGTAEFSGVIRNSGAAGGLTITGSGNLILSAANTYTGATSIGTNVTLSANDGVGLPTASFLSLDGGKLETNGTTSFTRSLGTSGSGKFQLTANGGGFVANGGQLTVNIGGAGGEVVWGTTVGSQIVGPLVFGSGDANEKTLFVNGINLNNTATAATRSISVVPGNTGGSAEMSGVIRNSGAAGGLSISGYLSTLILSGANTYTGTTTVTDNFNEGFAVRAVSGIGLPTASFLSLDAGVLEGSGTSSFTRSLGTSGSGKFQLTDNGGGFAANGGQLTVNIGGAGGEVVWGTTVGSQIVGTLKFGARDANAKTLFVNGIDLNNTASAATREIDLAPGTGGDSTEISGVIRNSNAAGNLIVSGFGGLATLILSGNNIYSGTTTSDAKLQIGNGGTTGTLGTGAVVNNGILSFNRSDSMTVGNAISGFGGVTQAGTGTTILTGTNSYGGTTAISAGALQANSGVGLPAARFLSLDGGVLQGNGTATFTRSLGTSGSTFQWTANGGGFSANGGPMTVNVGGAGAEVVWGSTVGSQIVGTLQFGSTTANAKTLFTNGIDLNDTATIGLTRTINVTGGAGGDSAEISGVIRNSGAAADLTKTGNGTLVLTGANTYTGATTISAGTLQIGNGSTGKLGSGGVTNNASLVFVTPNTSPSTVGNTISGSGTLTQGNVSISAVSWTLLSGSNSYTGTTSIKAGALQANDGVGLPTGSFLNLDGGTAVFMGNGTSTFNRSLGASGSGKFQWNTGGGGFAANGGQMTVNVGGAGGELVWGTTVGSQIVGPLVLGFPNATGKTLFVNGIDLNNTATAATRTITSLGGTVAPEISGVIRNSNSSGGLTIAAGVGDTPLFLSGANTYTGTTTINNGAVLRGNDGVGLPAASFLSLNGGVLEGNGTSSFTRSLGTSGSGKFQWTASGGGFSASGGQLTVNIGGAGGEVVWGTVVGSQIVGFLRLESGFANAKILFVNGIDLNNTSTAATRSIIVSNGVGSMGSAEISGVIRNSNAAGALTINAGSPLILSGNNTYSGTTTISGTLQIGNGGTTGTLGSGPVVDNGSLVFSRSDSITVGNATSGSGGLTQAGTGATILTGSNSYGGTTTISAGALQANDAVGLPAASYLKLDGGVLQGSGAVSFARSLSTSGASNFQWTANGGGFSANGGQMSVNVGGAGAEVTWGSTVGSQIVGTLQFGSPTANAKTLFVNGINLNSTATTGLTRTINVTAGTGGDSAEISGVIRNSGAATNLTKTGSGTLILTNANTYTGDTNINGGTLEADNATRSTGTGTVRVNADGTLSGVGKVTGNVIVDGTASDHQATLSPGHSVGTLAIAGSLTFESDGKLFYEIDSSAPATPAADLVTVTGNVTINSGAKLALSDPAALSIFPKKLTLISYTGILTGAFDGYANGSQFSVGGTTYQINYFDAGMGVNGGLGTGSYVTLSAVPEASVVLFGTLVCGVIGIGRGTRKPRRRAMA